MSKEAVIYWTQGSSVTSIVADATVSIGTTAPADVTDYFIEDAIDAADHIILRPETLSLELVQTETPLPAYDSEFAQELVKLDVRKSDFSPGGALALTEGIKGLIDSGLNAVGLTSKKQEFTVWLWRRGSDATRIAELHDLLLSARKAKALLAVDVGGRSYNDYAITDIEFSQTGPEEKGTFRLSLRHVRQAPSSSTDPALGLSLPSPGEIALAAAREAAKAALEQTPADIQAIKEKSILAAGGNSGLLDNIAGSLGL